MSKSKRFVLSDGTSVNSKGYRIDINGLDMKRFMSNPVMLYEHNTGNVLGRWTDIRKENDKLTAMPDFDMEDAEVLSIAGKVERGFLNGASIGLIVREIQIINGVDVVTKSELFEASIVSIPADSSAVRLYNDKLECLSIEQLKLSINQQKQNDMDHKDFYGQICNAIGLDKETDSRTVLEAIKKLKTDSEIDEALNMGALTVSEYKYYNKQLKNGDTAVLSIVAEKRSAYECERNEMLTKLYNENSEKIIASLGVEVWEGLKHFVKNGFPYEQVKKMVENLDERVTLSSMINRGGEALHDLDWYRKNNPKALQENHELYQTLLRAYKQESGQVQGKQSRGITRKH